MRELPKQGKCLMKSQYFETKMNIPKSFQPVTNFFWKQKLTQVGNHQSNVDVVDLVPR